MTASRKIPFRHNAVSDLKKQAQCVYIKKARSNEANQYKNEYDKLSCFYLCQSKVFNDQSVIRTSSPTNSYSISLHASIQLVQRFSINYSPNKEKNTSGKNHLLSKSEPMGLYVINLSATLHTVCKQR
jgi:hypothetical protein